MIAYYFIKAKVEDQVRQEEILKRRRIHKDSGRTSVAREHTGAPARVHRARTRKS